MLNVQLISDYSRATLRSLAARLQESRTLEELVYREAELGELWSLVDGDLQMARWRAAGGGNELGSLQRAIVAVIGLLTSRDDSAEAARRLRQALLERRGPSLQPAGAEPV
jgi:hypothetical protein